MAPGPGDGPGHHTEHTFDRRLPRSLGPNRIPRSHVRGRTQHKAVGRTPGSSAHPRLRVAVGRSGAAHSLCLPAVARRNPHDGVRDAALASERSALAGRRCLGPEVQLGAVGLDLAVDGESTEGHQRQNDDLLHCLHPFFGPVRAGDRARSPTLHRELYEVVTKQTSKPSRALPATVDRFTPTVCIRTGQRLRDGFRSAGPCGAEYPRWPRVRPQRT